MSGIIERLTENIVDRDLRKEGAALLNKWEKTGLLEGVGDDRSRATMARLLENQAKELLREASTMATGDVEGFASVAFPIVRRVFGGLIANELVSVQPMSLPSGLIFFLDFVYSPDANSNVAGAFDDESLFGGGVVGSQLTGGVDLSLKNADKAFYHNVAGYSHATGTVAALTVVATSGTVMNNVQWSAMTDAQKKAIAYDPDIAAQNLFVRGVAVRYSDIASLNTDNLVAIAVASSSLAPFTGDGSDADVADDTVDGVNSVNSSAYHVRRLTRFNPASAGVAAKTHIELFFAATSAAGLGNVGAPVVGANKVNLIYPRADSWGNANALGSIQGTTPWPLEGDNNDGTANIAEIDIKVDSIAVTAMTKKLKAKWSPELGQDLNAYHNLDAEVELTSILSEQIALEIDREILVDLVKGATAGTLYWNRRPGQFLNRETGASITSTTAPPDFTGTVSEWYETLVETINDVSARIHRKTLRGGANFLVVGPELANLLEFTSGFRANVVHDDNKGTVGAVKSGSISKKWDVYVDPYFPRNVVLIGRKGSSFLESGYVYAPYVPLQVTPTIFGIEDFVPRKGVMTRYSKKMVRPDMYGLVLVQDMLT
tara:strand:+ start:1852 stop:3657 length:1806 start_codon:yes stop_codon:yes gene_type:complete